ncbi:MAG: hypothetical protein OEV66_06295 [Spirochaetia bacterium]|nr:hypothetical protein [Spirochaetia bacterium]
MTSTTKIVFSIILAMINIVFPETVYRIRMRSYTLKKNEILMANEDASVSAFLASHLDATISLSERAFFKNRYFLFCVTLFVIMAMILHIIEGRYICILCILFDLL